MRLHAALMAQNEILDLSRNVKALLSVVDSVTVVDGGSIDNTISFMRNWERQDARIRFFIHPWHDNFPEQRNNYLRRVAEIATDGDWILAVDPDEFVEPASLPRLRVTAARAQSLGYRRVGLQCRSVSLRGHDICWENLDDYRKGLLYQWRPDLHYYHTGEGAVHETLANADPVVFDNDLLYSHEKQENCVWNRGVRNYFIGGGGPNLGSQNHRWVELKALAGRLGLDTWHRFHAYLIAGNIDGALKDWIIRYRHETGWDGSSEQREFFKTYFRMYHPEEEPAELRGEVIE